MTITKILTTFISAAMLVSFSQESFAISNEDHNALAKTMLENHIRPGYDRLLTTSQSLQKSMSALCAAPSSIHKQAVDQDFFATLLAFSRVEHLRFGAILEDHRKERLVFWPDRKSTGLKQIKRSIVAEDKILLSLKSLQQKSVALQGLTALEFVLFGKGKEALEVKGKQGDFRCGYGKAIAQNVVSIATQVKQGWADGAPYTKAFLHPSSKSEIYMSPKETTRELFLSMLTGIKLVKDFKLAAPLGKSLEKARPWKAAFWRSGQAFNVMTSNLLGVRDMLEQGGFAKVAESAEPGIAASIAFELNHVTTVLSSLKKPIKAVVTDKVERAKLQALFPALGNIYDNAGTSIAKATDMTAGFNALDGD